jgi:hypothetical protein
MYAVILACMFLAVAAGAGAQTDSSGAIKKSPSTAVLYSFLLPGLGQVYTESYWKVPIFAGGALTSAYFIATNQSQFASASQNYDNALAQGQSASVTSTLLRQREFYRNNRDVAGLALLLTYALAAVDAYVGANLHDFNVDANLSINVLPTPTSPLAVNLQLRF